MKINQGKIKKNSVKPKMLSLKNILQPKRSGSLFTYFIIGLVVLFLANLYLTTREVPEEKSFTEIVTLVSNGEVSKILETGSKLEIELNDGTKYTSRKDQSTGLEETFSISNIDYSNVKIVHGDPEKNMLFRDLLMFFGPVLLIIVLFWFIFRNAKGGGGDMFAFGKSRARLFSKDQPKITFDDVGGVEEAKKELQEVVDFLKYPKKYLALGARIPKGVLLVGPSGTGKTLMAKAVAGEASVPFYSIAGSEFMEILVGVGASRVRDLFKTAKASSPSLIFIDEIESIGRQRSVGIGGAHDEREQTLNQILVEMDGFEPNDNVIILGATNRPDLLDPALIRAGRFDRRVVVGFPDIEGRQKILKIHMQGKPFAKDVEIEKLAQRTVGYSGADLENMLNEAAIIAAVQNKKEITTVELEEAATKVKLGPEKRRKQTELTRKMTAYHEAGHAVVMHALPDMDPVHSISIVSRGLALGFTLAPPQTDRYHETKARFLAMITSFMGGRAAEELIFNELTSGARDDIKKANEIARLMVTEYGMSNLGPLNITKDEQDMYSIASMNNTFSQELMSKADKEVERIIGECSRKAMELLKSNKEQLDMVAEYLLKYETIRQDEFELLMKGKAKKK